MSWANDIENIRAWMYQKCDPITKANTVEFNEGLKEFLRMASNQPSAIQSGKIFCPCVKCKNSKILEVSKVGNHLFRMGFMPFYYFWLNHGEELGGGTSSGNVDGVGRRRPRRRVGDDLIFRSESNVLPESLEPETVESETIGTVEMVHEVLREAGIDYMETNRTEEPNAEARKFYEMLDAANNPIYDGCKVGHSPLSAATRMMAIKTDNSLSESCVDQILEFLKDYLPEGNLVPGTFDEVERLVGGMGLPYQVIDVCTDNCMIYWDKDKDKTKCEKCQKERYQVTGGRTKVPYKRMWYLPIADRLKRLYQSEVTAKAMRWHAEHNSGGDINHPSDAKAWKHFNTVHPSFACESRNVYLGLSTDGFNPFGKSGRKYSLWPVIVTPYNLPPSLCMKREYLFLSVLVPGPNHPKQTLDIFLQPLIRELQILWSEGVEAYDISKSQNFRLRAVLMWTISDFPAYGMLSGWTTHGKLSCPYCGADTDSFQLHHGRKTSWFDCHRRFLDMTHPYRKNKRLFRKKRAVTDEPPSELSGQALLHQINRYRIERTTECAGTRHKKARGYGDNHHWHKKSIFWDLPYWKDHLLRYNLDVMHVEKNFFDNIINTVLNVPGKTKDNLNSRLDLPELCCRESLHVQDGVGPIPSFRLEGNGKTEFFEWLRYSVKYPDGYASNISNCVDANAGKLTGMKSHDCHVFMERLLPMAFTHLLQKDVHEAIAGVGAFFRDLCSRTLTEAGVNNLKERIPIILCNMERLFPPSFFDVMEHLAIHLPRELELGGPVQYRWMYPFERYMFHLKKKVKNPSRVEGSIVAQQIREETSAFSSNYFPRTVKTKATRPGRYDDGGEKPVYPSAVPDMFEQIGRLSGKMEKKILNQRDLEHLHKYIVENCDELEPYVRIFYEHLRAMKPNVSDDELEAMKHGRFAEWLKTYTSVLVESGHRFPTWLVELAKGPAAQVSLYPQYCTRGYVFQVQGPSRTRATVNNGVLVRSGSTEYYGVLKEIIEVEYPGFVSLRCVMFRCDWYNPTDGVGVKHTKFGVTEVNTSKKLREYDPFCTASQADQVCYIRYPRITQKRDPWITVQPINPRGRVIGVAEQDPLQQVATANVNISLIDQPLQEPVLAGAQVDVLEDWNSEEEGEVSDVESDDEDSAPSVQYSSDSAE